MTSSVYADFTDGRIRGRRFFRPVRQAGSRLPTSLIVAARRGASADPQPQVIPHRPHPKPQQAVESDGYDADFEKLKKILAGGLAAEPMTFAISHAAPTERIPHTSGRISTSATRSTGRHMVDRNIKDEGPAKAATMLTTTDTATISPPIDKTTASAANRTNAHPQKLFRIV